MMDFNSLVTPFSKRGKERGGKVKRCWGSEGGRVGDPRSTLTNLHLILAGSLKIFSCKIY